MDQSSDLSEKNPRTPALRAIGRNRTLVFASLLYVAFKALDDAAAEDDASTSATDARAFHFGGIPTGESSPAVPFLH